ncbi:hypothetical protein GCM10009785_13360 [Brooklawnia cerclae]|uniref:Uncharacterized protein n=1 Tax=Brooklawnia cerclae TaxID=349934 RepID=A0ABX0SKA1_9ACTN|nr:hypothetical protein [Brooklawnia cerclae]NIH58749.1 hypothetical protein [Brooklawnia cerclae]
MPAKHVRRLAVAFAALLVVMSTSTQAASAAPDEPGTISRTSSVPLSVDHYDAAVAAAHGFEIRTRADGNQHPVPVTQEAQAIAAEYPLVNGVPDSGASPQGFDEKEGPCGSAYVSLTRDLNNRDVYINTGFAVTAPVSYRSWSVQLMGTAGINHQPFSGGESPAVWGDSRTVFYPSGGIGYVTAGSHVMLVTGAVCYSYGPQTSF